MKNLRLTEEELARLKAKQVVEPAGAKPSKYGNQKCVVDGIEFDSLREGRRWSVLLAQLAAGEIRDLRRQVPFVIIPAATVLGRRVAARKYIADFVYVRAGATVVEDSKGMLTPMYRLKRQLMKVVHGIDIVEV